MAGSNKCRVCISPYRKDIELLLKKNVMQMDIARHYAPFFEIDVRKLYESILTHTEKKHPPLIGEIPQLSTYEPPKPPEPAPQAEPDVTPKQKVTIEEYAGKLLDMGMSEEQLKKVNPQVILQAQKILIEKQKAENQRDVLRLAMERLFSGLMKPKHVTEVIQDGSIVEEAILPEGGEENES